MKLALLIAISAIVPAISLFAADATEPAAPTVAVLPFQILNNTPNSHWISDAVQQSLATDVARNPNLQLASSHAAPTIDSEAAVKAAKDAGATIVTFGSIQINDTEIRIAGYLMDVSTGKIFSAIKTSGPILQLFTLEDHLDEQLNIALGSHLPALASHLEPIGSGAVASASTDPTAYPVPQQNSPSPINYSALPPVVYYANPQSAPSNTYGDAIDDSVSNDESDLPQLGIYYQPNSFYGYGYTYPVFFGRFGGSHEHHRQGEGGTFPRPHPTSPLTPHSATNSYVHPFNRPGLQPAFNSAGNFPAWHGRR
jgi:TolB-like protein